MEKKKIRNSSSSLRIGFDYQTVWAFRFCYEFLIHPEQYEFLQIETAPDEYPEGKKFFLDDIILCRKDNSYCLYQIKTTAHWSFKILLEQEKSKKDGLKVKDSLIKKWFDSFINSPCKISEASLLTSGSPDEELKQYILPNNCLDIQKLKSENLTMFNTIKLQLGDENKVFEFFKIFNFKFNQEEINELEKSTRQLYFNSLKATDSGMTNLLNELQKESRKENTIKLTYEMIRNFCDFDKSRPLNEEFNVPTDFQVFNDSYHKRLICKIEKNSSGTQVILGNPGVGKSTYLSYLSTELKKSKIPIIKHHYHIETDDTNPFERLRSDRIIEAMKFQLKEYQDLIGNYALKDSKNISIKEYINELALNVIKENKVAVIIIDGLDHVIRHGSEQDLRNFIYEIYNPQEGIWYIFGLQPMAKIYLPVSIISEQSESEWITIQGLSKELVFEIIKKNNIGLKFNEDFFERFFERIYEISQGNPLHLRYSLGFLKNTIIERNVVEQDCDKLLSYDNNIENYYKKLWISLDPYAKSSLIAVSLIDTKLHSFHIKDLISNMGVVPCSINIIFNQITHLLKSDSTGISIYHNSFEEFIKNSDEFCDQSKATMKCILKWINESSYDFIKWAELAKLEYKLGNPNLLMDINYNWLLDAIKQAKPSYLILMQLNLASKAALDIFNLPKMFQFLNLSTYLNDAIKFSEEAFEAIWCLVISSTRETKFQKIKILTIKQCETLAISAHYNKNLDLYYNILTELKEKHIGYNFQNKNGFMFNKPILAECFVRLLALECKKEFNNIYDYIIKFRKYNWSTDLFSTLTNSLIKNNEFDLIKKILDLQLEVEEKYIILKECIFCELKSSENYFKIFIENFKHDYPLITLFKFIKYNINPPNFFPDYKFFLETINDYEVNKCNEISKKYVDIFLNSLCFYLANKKLPEKHFRKNSKLFQFKFIILIINFSKYVAESINSKSYILIENLLIELSKLDCAEIYKDRKIFGYKKAIPEALREIIYLVDLISINYNLKNEFTIDRLKLLFSKEYFNKNYYDRENWLNSFLDLDHNSLSQDALNEYFNDEELVFSETIVSFSERSIHYSKLAELAKRYNHNHKFEHFIYLACKNLISYQNHKDIFLSNVMDALLSSVEYYKERPEILLNWIKDLSPIVLNITKYTDGDETRHFPKQFSNLIAKISRDLAFKYYKHFFDLEDFFLSNSIFSVILESMNPKIPLEFSICATAIDDESYNTLKSLVIEDDKYFEALNKINLYIGEIPEKTDNYNYGNQKLLLNNQDYLIVKESELDEYLDKEETIFLKSEFLFKWIDINLKKSNISEEKAFRITLKKIEELDSNHLSENLLDLICHHLRKSDSDKCFDFLCLAQRNSHGWLFFSDEIKTKNRWDFLLKYFPTKWKDFLKHSLVYTFDGNKLSFSIERLIDFLVKFKQVEIVKNIIEEAIKFTKFLMADLKLEDSKWYDSSEIGLSDLLFIRLEYPSPIVRERAASEIANQLINGNIKLNQILNWISHQDLESKIILGLLPLAKATKLGFNINSNEILPFINKYSLAIQKIIINICPNFKQNNNIITLARESTKVLHSNSFFNDNINFFIPPFFSEVARNIDNIYKKDFKKNWEYEYYEIIKELNFKNELGKSDLFFGDKNSGYILGFSSKISEVYKTAFMRTLELYNKKNYIDKHLYFDIIDKFIPIDLSFWSLELQRSSNWWPHIKFPSDKNSIKIDTIEISDKFENLPEFGGNIVLGIDGTVKPNEGWLKGIPRSRIKIFSFLYQINGSNLPKKNDILSLLDSFNSFELDSSIEGKTISILDNKFKSRKCLKINDLIIYPLFGRIEQKVNNTWQWWRIYHAPFAPQSIFGDINDIKINNNCLEYLDINNRLISTSIEWTEGISERFFNNQEPRHGTYISVNKKHLDKLIRETNLRFAHIVEYSHKINSNYEDKENEIISDIKIHGLSSIII